MRIAYLDCFSGISGDMFLGALVDAGVDAELLRQTVASMDIGASLEVRHVDRSGIESINVDVVIEGAVHEHAGEAHGHDHKLKLETKGRGEHDEDTRPHHPSPGSRHTHARGLVEIRQLIQRVPISPQAQQIATRTFELLGAAEAGIHNVPLEQIHFHELGAVDSIVDIVCAAVGCRALGIERWFCSPLNLGSGTVECAHGRYPVPAPATLELLKGAPVYSSGLDAELVTPTGAALLRALEVDFGPFPSMRIETSGYGAGKRNPPGQANVLRLTIGETSSPTAVSETVCVLETAVDDLNPQILGYVIEQALASGALDVFSTPVQMKKNRPGTLITVLCVPADADRMRDLLLLETSTLGVRMRTERRDSLAREFVSVATRWGEVRLKIARLNGEVVNYAPEYEDCRRIAQAHGVPLKIVMQEALRHFGQR